MEIDVAISKLFEKLKDAIPTTITIKTHATWVIPEINENSTLGEQIKYYRRLAHIKQPDLALKLGYERGALHHIENNEIKLININLIKDIIKELKIEDKININDDYISFLLGNPSKVIRDFRKKHHLKKNHLAKMLKTDITAITKWETGRTQMTRTSYNKFKKLI